MKLTTRQDAETDEDADYLQNDAEVLGANDTAIQESCKWPPGHIENIMVNGAYNITLCVRGLPSSRKRTRPKSYPLDQLFHIKGKNLITYEQMNLLPRRFWKRMRKPNIWKVYPQDVPIAKIVRNIKEGRAVYQVRFVSLFRQKYMLFYFSIFSALNSIFSQVYINNFNLWKSD